MKYESGGKDPYIDTQTGLLRNSVNARSQPELDRIEAAFSAVRSYELERTPAAGKFDLDHLRAVHKTLFSDVYPWAGEVRSVIIGKGSTAFAMPEHIETAGRDLFRQLARENHLRGMDPDKFADRAGHYLGEVNVLHPFREGNGRAQRAFIGQLADGAGYHIAWDRVSRDDMTKASIDAYRGNPEPMARLIRDNLTDRDHLRAIELGRSLAGVQASVTPAEIGQSYTGRVLGTTDRYIVQERSDVHGELVLHSRQRVAGDFHDLDALRRQPVEIRYPQGDVGVMIPVKKGIEGPEKAKNHDHGLEK
ncbi:MAG: Fic family protein [Burkholderia gladioli]